MAGAAKPFIDAIEGSWIINGSKFYSGYADHLFNGIVGAYQADWAYWYSSTEDNYLDITFNQKTNVWGIPTTSYQTYDNPLKIFKYTNESWVYLGNTLKGPGNGSWFKLVSDLPTGRYKFTSGVSPGYSLWTEWFIEGLFLIKYLVKNGSNILKFNNSWEIIGSAPPTEELFDEYGMDYLSVINIQQDKVIIPMTSQDLDEGKLWRGTVDKTAFNIRKIEVV